MQSTSAQPVSPVHEAPQVGVILGQIGSPQTLHRKEVRRYLKEFLSDQRVIDLPRWRWKPILHWAILPRRPRRVSENLAQIWTEEGSPLQVISLAQQRGLQERLGSHFQVELGLMYSEPSMKSAVAKLEASGIKKIVVLPMFPQYSNSTTAAIYDEATFHVLGRGRRRGLPVKKYAATLRFVHPYFDDPRYIRVLADNLRRQIESLPHRGKIILSFHGVPKRFIEEGDPYLDHVEETAALLMEELGVSEDGWELGFQSRFGRTEWIKPYLQPRLEVLYQSGVTHPILVSPGFTADCLETLHELAIDGRELFAKGGGNPDNYFALSCLNDDPDWLDYAAQLVRENSAGW